MSGSLSLGEFRLLSLYEWEGFTVPLPQMFTTATAAHLDAARAWLEPHYLRPDNVVRMGTQSFIVRTPQHTILIDGCVGNDKPRAAEHFNRMHTPYLENMAQLGFTPDDFDLVILTHMHIDHVGWFTRLDGDQWVPTFPKARYIFVQDEWAYWKDFPADDYDAQQCIRDSIMPIVAAGQADLVAANTVIAAGVCLEALPGHTPGHTAVHLSSGGQELIIAGDLLHHPIQVAAPELGIPPYDFDHRQAIQTRQAFLEHYADSPVLITCTHFASPGVGRLVRDGTRLRFEVVG